MPDTTRGRGRPPIHPWADWLDGARHVLVAGVDWTTGATPHGLATQVKRKAKATGVDVTVTAREDGAVVIEPVVQA